MAQPQTHHVGDRVTVDPHAPGTAVGLSRATAQHRATVPGVIRRIDRAPCGPLHVVDWGQAGGGLGRYEAHELITAQAPDIRAALDEERTAYEAALVDATLALLGRDDLTPADLADAPALPPVERWVTVDVDLGHAWLPAATGRWVDLTDRNTSLAQVLAAEAEHGIAAFQARYGARPKRVQAHLWDSPEHADGGVAHRTVDHR